MKVLVTGSSGFIGKNIVKFLSQIPNMEVCEFTRTDKFQDLELVAKSIDFIFHLAGVNRSNNPDDFYKGNCSFLKKVISIFENNNPVPIVFSSSIHVSYKKDDYGSSKIRAENLILNYAERQNVNVFIYRLSNVFGKWSKPNYNSVISTWCYNISRNIELSVSDRAAKLEFIYIDDVVKEFISCLKKNNKENKILYIKKTYKKSLGEVYDLLYGFNRNRSKLLVPRTGKGFERKLYATYLSYLPIDSLSFSLPVYSDDRGDFTEIIKTIDSGQISISTSLPGVVRGDHFHHTKSERFVVIKGEALLELRQINKHRITKYYLDEKELKVVEVVPGYSHRITNVGNKDMVLLIWSNEVFDKKNPDTFPLKV